MELSGLTWHVPVWHLTVLSLVSSFRSNWLARFRVTKHPGTRLKPRFSACCVWGTVRHILCQHLCNLGVPSGASKTISEPMVRFGKIVQLSYINTNTVSKRTEGDSTWPTSPRSSIGCVQNDFRAYGSSVETMHQSCIKISTISKWTKTSFQLSIVT